MGIQLANISFKRSTALPSVLYKYNDTNFSKFCFLMISSVEINVCFEKSKKFNVFINPS